jgi:hypothetical protein
MKILSTLFVILFIHLTTFSQLVSTAVQQTSTSCFGICDGTAFIITTGGQPPYIVTGPAANAPQTYNSGITLFGICAGTHTFLVTDALNQTVPVIVTIAQPAQLVLTTNPTNETTIGACDGQIVALVTGGTSPFMYSINGGVGQGSSTFGNLCAGSYQVCVTDANGCTTCNSVVTVGSNGGTNCSNFAVTSVQQQNITCNGTCDGSAFLIATGAQPPYVVSGNFTNSPITFTSGTTLSGFCAGPQIVGVTSSDGCVFQYTMVFTEPSPLVITTNPTPETANGVCDGQIVAVATGGTGAITYTINGGSSQSSNTFTNLCAGSYTICASDANGCSTCETVTIIPGGGCNLVTTQFQHTPATCNGTCDGSLVIAASGGQLPYIVAGNFTGSPFTFTSSAYLQGLCGGTTTLTVSSSDGCVSYMNVAIVEPPVIQVAATISVNVSSVGTCDGVLVGTATGGTPGYVYNWMDCITQASIGTQPTLGNACAGDYAFQATDINGCTVTSSCVTLSATSSLAENENSFEVSVFPNPSNGLFTIELNSTIESQIEMSIQDISGSIVYKTLLTANYQTFDLNNELSNGVYLVTLNGISNKTFKLVIQK